jgi:predicted phosphate transport protein (TIGR00153 family)
VRLGLVPRTTEFYILFAKAGANALEAARKTEERFRTYPNATVTQEDVKAIEHEGDRITHDIIQLLNTQYVTPFDREDIYELVTAIDDVVDLIEEASDLIELYGVDSATRYAVRQCEIIVSAVECLERGLAGLKALGGLQPILVELKSYEDEGDRVAREAIAALFQDPRIDPLIVIRWKDIYEALEGAVDACETAANVLGNIVVKNA